MTAAEKEFYKQVGLQIRRLRRRRGTSQYRLAEVVGMSRSDLAKLELGMTSVRGYRLYLICRALDCDVNDVLPDPHIRGRRASVPYP